MASGTSGNTGGLLDEVLDFHSPDPVDPVFEGMVKDFNHFDENLKKIHQQLEAFTDGIGSISGSLENLSDLIVTKLAHDLDPHIASESVKLREATNRIIREDAPHSAVSKLRRDLDHNITVPVKEFLDFHDKLREKIEIRRRRLRELRCAREQIEECTRLSLDDADHRLKMAQAELQTSRAAFRKIDSRLFQWMYILEEYRGDILDSTVQTLKYLQYEFFASSAHALSGALPASMEFRPMVEMVPDCLQAQLESERRDALEEISLGDYTSFSTRLVERLAQERGVEAAPAAGPGGPPPAQVDALSLSSLLAHGFEEAQARRALRIHHNDTQAALDWLVSGKGAEEPTPGFANANSGRIPRTAGRAHVEPATPVTADCVPSDSRDRLTGLARVFGQARPPSLPGRPPS